MTTTKLRSRIAASISAVPPICASAPTTMKPAAAGRSPAPRPRSRSRGRRRTQSRTAGRTESAPARAERAQRAGQFALHGVARRLGGRGGKGECDPQPLAYTSPAPLRPNAAQRPFSPLAGRGGSQLRRASLASRRITRGSRSWPSTPKSPTRRWCFSNWLRPRPRPSRFKGIAEGRRELELSCCTPTPAQFILTLYEKRVKRGRPAVLHRPDGASGAERGVNCPQPVRARDGEALGRLARPRRRRSSPFSTACLAAPAAGRPLRPGRRGAGAHARGGRRLRACAAPTRSSIDGWPPLFAAADAARRRGRARPRARRPPPSSPRCRRSGRAACRAASSTPTSFPTTCSSSATGCPA